MYLYLPITYLKSNDLVVARYAMKAKILVIFMPRFWPLHQLASALVKLVKLDDTIGSYIIYLHTEDVKHISPY